MLGDDNELNWQNLDETVTFLEIKISQRVLKIVS
jgi:hypothetical protein